MITKGKSIYDIHDFQREVIERSFQVPVVVDFWAEWCGPCKILGPILEKLVQAQRDRWVLAKVDTEELTDEAISYGIQSIPNVKMFFEGKVIGEFVGALPEYAVSQWLKKVLPGKNTNQIEAAKALLQENQEEEARRLLERIHEEDPGDAETSVLLAKCIVLTDPAAAASLVANIDEPKLGEQREMITTFVYLFDIAGRPDLLPQAPAKQLYLEGIAAIRKGEFTAALKKFIEIIRADRYYDEDGSRKACIAIFKYLGEEHPVTLEFRRDFSNALY